MDIFFGEKKIFNYVTQKTFYNIMTFMVYLFQNLFNPLCGFLFFKIVLTELKREEFSNSVYFLSIAIIIVALCVLLIYSVERLHCFMVL
jgi:hypothetical protein